MAYKIIGTIYRIGETENISTKNGNNIQRRELILQQRRYDQNTGKEYEPNFPSLEFINSHCSKLDAFNEGDIVTVSFEIQGTKYIDKRTGKERVFNRSRAFFVEIYVRPSSVPAADAVVQPSSDDKKSEGTLPF